MNYLPRRVQLEIQDELAGRMLVSALADYLEGKQPAPLSIAIAEEFLSAPEIQAMTIRCRKRSHVMSELSRLLGWRWYNAKELRQLRRNEQSKVPSRSAMQ